MLLSDFTSALAATRDTSARAISFGMRGGVGSAALLLLLMCCTRRSCRRATCVLPRAELPARGGARDAVDYHTADSQRRE